MSFNIEEETVAVQKIAEAVDAASVKAFDNDDHEAMVAATIPAELALISRGWTLDSCNGGVESSWVRPGYLLELAFRAGASGETLTAIIKEVA